MTYWQGRVRKLSWHNRGIVPAGTEEIQEEPHLQQPVSRSIRTECLQCTSVERLPLPNPCQFCTAEFAAALLTKL
jgi:hypothetical protein